MTDQLKPRPCPKCGHDDTYWQLKCIDCDDVQPAAEGRAASSGPPAWPLPLTVDDIAQIIEAIDNFVIGPSYPPDPELVEIWQPYIDKLNALKSLAAGVPVPPPSDPKEP